MAEEQKVIDRRFLINASQLIKIIDQLRGKYIKIILSNMEKQGNLTKDQRKAILDGVNGMTRELYKVLGFDYEE